MKNTAPSINLLKDQKKNFTDKFLDWSLTIGRVVVILTEGIALAAFIYRFALDRELIDLRDNIKDKQAIVNAASSNEDKFRNLQQRLRLIAVLQTDETPQKILSDITAFIPSDVFTKSIVFSLDRIKIEANARSATSLAKFVTAVRTYPKVTSVSIDKIENKTSSGTIVISITATLKQSKIPSNGLIR